MRQWSLIHRVTLLLLALSLLIVVFATPRPTQAEPRCFPEAAPVITHCIDGRFLTYWEQQGGLPVFGYPLSGAYEEQTELGPRTVQLFERARLELHPTNPPPYDVQLSHLGRAAVPTAAAPEPPQPGCRHFPQTGQNVCPPFLQAWQSFGLELGVPGITEDESLALFGLPLTPARPETLSDGQTYIVQWFERARFEDHGQHGVLFGLLGRELSGDIPAAAPAQPAPAQPAPAQPAFTPWHNPYGPLEPGGFIQVSGSELVRLGQPIRLKGVNYYPQWRPWAEMWEKWDGPQMERELRLARDMLGINAVRVLVPYDVAGEGNVDNSLIHKLRELCQIAGNLDMRLIVTLFDFHEDFPQPGTGKEREHIRYLERLIGNFVGDDRILAWDLHNEPDHYERWEEHGEPHDVLTWLGRMADVVHQLAPNHLVTVGMGQYQNLLVAGPDGRRVIDYSDIISVHIYNADDAARQIDELRAHTSKPIIVQEFGWPSGPPCTTPGYTEAQQQQVYQKIIGASEGRAVGVFAWTLRDYDPGPTRRWDTYQEHYGLFRPDDSLKPAAALLRDYAAPPLPSLTRIEVELTPDRDRGHQGERSAKLIEEAGFYVKKDFREAWDTLGGRGSFGLPLNEAFIRPEDGHIVQYFESAVLELFDEPANDPSYSSLSDRDKLMYRIRPTYLGLQYTAGRTFPPPPPPPPDSRHFPETGYWVSGDFWSAYENLLGPWRLGAAISPELSEDIGGRPVTVQYFQKGRLERDPETGGIYPSQLGTWEWGNRCRSTQ